VGQVQVDFCIYIGVAYLLSGNKLFRRATEFSLALTPLRLYKRKTQLRQGSFFQIAFINMASTMSTDMASNITMDKGVGCGINDLQMWQSAVKALELWIRQLYLHIKSMAAHGHAHNNNNALKQLARDLKRIWASFRPTQFCPGAVSFNHDQRRAIDLIIRYQLQNKYPHMSYNIMVSQFEDSMRAELDVVTRQLDRTKCLDVTDFESFDLNQVLERVPTQG
jgi:hypothetical protein